MTKRFFKPGTMLNPVPAVMVSCGDDNEKNIITIAWTGIINSDPPITYVSVRKSRHSHKLISETGEFVINLVTEKLAFAADYCGVKSGRDVDKFAEQKLTAQESKLVGCPSIKESPVNLECKVMEVKEFPTHDMFIAEIVSISVDEDIIDESDRICLDEAGLVAYNHGHYFGLKRDEIGRFGFSVMKPKTKKRLAKEKNARRRNGKQGERSRRTTDKGNKKAAKRRGDGNLK